MTDNVTITTDVKTSQEHARREFERMWATLAGFDLPKHVGDAWWKLTKLPDEDGMTLSEWTRIGKEKGWLTYS